MEQSKLLHIWQIRITKNAKLICKKWKMWQIHKKTSKLCRKESRLFQLLTPLRYENQRAHTMSRNKDNLQKRDFPMFPTLSGRCFRRMHMIKKSQNQKSAIKGSKCLNTQEKNIHFLIWQTNSSSKIIGQQRNFFPEKIDYIYLDLSWSWGKKTWQ